jgi:hypothetical protein
MPSGPVQPTAPEILPIWKQYAQKAFDGTIDALMGFIVLPQNESKASLAGELVQAGLPFASIAKMKGLRQLYHGTPSNTWEKFNPEVYNKHDVLGHMTHSAENPNYAASYATKQGTNARGQRMIPLVPEANNVLDLVDPNADDVAQALQFANPTDRRALINSFKLDKQLLDRTGNLNNRFYHNYHTQADPKEMPIRKLAEDLRLPPETTENMPWDAIRYLDVNEKSWAFPKQTPLRTAYGVPMNDAAEQVATSPIKMVRDDSVSSGRFPILSKATNPVAKKPDFSQYETVPPHVKSIANYNTKNATTKKNMFDFQIGDTVTNGLNEFEIGTEAQINNIIKNNKDNAKKYFVKDSAKPPIVLSEATKNKLMQDLIKAGYSPEEAAGMAGSKTNGFTPSSPHVKEDSFGYISVGTGSNPKIYTNSEAGISNAIHDTKKAFDAGHIGLSDLIEITEHLKDLKGKFVVPKGKSIVDYNAKKAKPEVKHEFSKGDKVISPFTNKEMLVLDDAHAASISNHNKSYSSEKFVKAPINPDDLKVGDEFKYTSGTSDHKSVLDLKIIGPKNLAFAKGKLKDGSWKLVK